MSDEQALPSMTDTRPTHVGGPELEPSPVIKVLEGFAPIVKAMEAETGVRMVQVPIALALELEKAGIIHSTGGIGWRMGDAPEDELEG